MVEGYTFFLRLIRSVFGGQDRLEELETCIVPFDALMTLCEMRNHLISYGIYNPTAAVGSLL